MKIGFIAACLLLLITPGMGMASDYTVFTKDIVEPYGLYKKSLALTSKVKNREKAIVVVAKFVDSWKKLADKYENDTPDMLRETVDFSGKIKRPAMVGEGALAMLKSGEVKKAHAHLEEVRYALWQIRTDAGIVSLNDKVNDFHEAMEVVLNGMKENAAPENLRHLGARYGAWLTIKWAEVGNMDGAIVDKTAFAQEIEEGHQAIATLVKKLKEGNFAEAQKTAGKVKKSYKAIFFLPECS
ncbi:MAG: hypothetical protein KAS94_08210 [Desulfobulbaceae bacterium]|nr:hypothetical protein [Desulfobulbaceae bacterium]